MITKEKLFKSPDYLLTKYQNEIFRQVSSYMAEHNLSQKEMAERLNVSTPYVNQILKGKFNFTLKKLIQLSLAIGLVPNLQFIPVARYLDKNSNKISLFTKPRHVVVNEGLVSSGRVTVLRTTQSSEIVSDQSLAQNIN